MQERLFFECFRKKGCNCEWHLGFKTVWNLQGEQKGKKRKKASSKHAVEKGLSVILWLFGEFFSYLFFYWNDSCSNLPVWHQRSRSKSRRHAGQDKVEHYLGVGWGGGGVQKVRCCLIKKNSDIALVRIYGVDVLCSETFWKSWGGQPVWQEHPCCRNAPSTVCCETGTTDSVGTK